MAKTVPIRILGNCDDDVKALMENDEKANRMDKASYTSYLIWIGIEERTRELLDKGERKKLNGKN